MIRLTGIGASEGISIGKVFIYLEDNIDLEEHKYSKSTEFEFLKLEEGITKTQAQILAIREKVKNDLGEKKAEIFDAHLEILEDEELIKEIKELIQNEGYSALYAMNEKINENIELFNQLDDAYLKERAADLRDICKRWSKNILGIKIKDLSNLEPNTVVLTYDLTPSDTAQLDLQNCIGFVTEIGGKTAHSAIMARSLEIPAVVGIKGIISTTKDQETIIIDGEKGVVYLSPTDELIKEYTEIQEKYLNDKKRITKN